MKLGKEVSLNNEMESEAKQSQCRSADDVVVLAVLLQQQGKWKVV